MVIGPEDPLLTEIRLGEAFVVFFGLFRTLGMIFSFLTTGNEDRKTNFTLCSC